MNRLALDIQTRQKLREALDWTVFTLGVLSLTVAISATVLTRTNLFNDTDHAQDRGEIATISAG